MIHLLSPEDFHSVFGYFNTFLVFINGYLVLYKLILLDFNDVLSIEKMLSFLFFHLLVQEIFCHIFLSSVLFHNSLDHVRRFFRAEMGSNWQSLNFLLKRLCLDIVSHLIPDLLFHTVRRGFFAFFFMFHYSYFMLDVISVITNKCSVRVFFICNLVFITTLRIMHCFSFNGIVILDNSRIFWRWNVATVVKSFNRCNCRSRCSA